MVEAYERGLVRSGRAQEIAAQVQDRLVVGGMTPTQAAEAYLAVHSLVLGFALVRSTREPGAAADARGESRQLSRLVDRLLVGLAPRPAGSV